MNRRGFIKRAAAVVVSLAVARELPKEEYQTDYQREAVKTVKNSDTSSVWIVQWGEDNVQQITKKISDGVFYGDVGENPEQFSGLAGRYTRKGLPKVALDKLGIKS